MARSRPTGPPWLGFGVRALGRDPERLDSLLEARFAG